MAGTKIGGQKAKEKNLKNDPDFYRKIGAKGGRNGRGPNYKGGFAANHELARIAGAKGGKKSRRTGIRNGEGKEALKQIEIIEQILEEESGRNR